VKPQLKLPVSLSPKEEDVGRASKLPLHISIRYRHADLYLAGCLEHDVPFRFRSAGRSSLLGIVHSL
jgi:hypothetical protein